MRKGLIAMVAGLAALAACNGNEGQGPNRHHADSPYDRYVIAREAALQGKAAVPEAIPVTLPRNAPTPDQIRPQPAAAPAAPASEAGMRKRPARQAATGYAGTLDVLTRYAAAVDNDPGEARFSRSPGAADSARACAGFATPEDAQIAFIARGGPQQDPLGLDPDGDGFVCGWDPRPLRAAGL